MSAVQLRAITAACPNARFQLLDTYGGTSLMGSLAVIGARTEAVIMRGFVPGEDSTVWANLWGNCKGLKELYIRSCISENIPLIFSVPKSLLTTLELTMDSNTDQEQVKKTLDICATGTNCVQRFIYSGPALSRDNTAKFLLANGASLLSIVVKSSSSVSGSKLDDFLNTLLNLPKLNELVYNCEIAGGTQRVLQTNGIVWKRNVFH